MDYFRFIGFNLESDEDLKKKNQMEGIKEESVWECGEFRGGQLQRLEVSVRAKAGSQLKYKGTQELSGYEGALGTISFTKNYVQIIYYTTALLKHAQVYCQELSCNHLHFLVALL